MSSDNKSALAKSTTFNIESIACLEEEEFSTDEKIIKMRSLLNHYEELNKKYDLCLLKIKKRQYQ